MKTTESPTPIPFQKKQWRKVSVLILNEEGHLIYAGAPNDTDHSTNCLWWPHPAPKPMSLYSDSPYTHGYKVWNGVWEQMPCQVILAIPFVNGDSNHGAIPMWGRYALRNISGLNDIDLGDDKETYSGECYSTLTSSEVESMAGQRERLSGFMFNLKGSASDAYRSPASSSMSMDYSISPPVSPTHSLNSYIPEALIAVHPLYDRYIDILSPTSSIRLNSDNPTLSPPEAGCDKYRPTQFKGTFFKSGSHMEFDNFFEEEKSLEEDIDSDSYGIFPFSP